MKNTYKVTITEMLQMTVEVEAEDAMSAEQMVNDNWQNSEYILDAENFIGVEFHAEEVTEGGGI